MSVVYKGVDMSLNREVAVKVLHPHLAGQDEARQRFQREAHAVAKLRHENILEIFDYSGRDSVDSYIVTEFIKGRTLRGFVNDEALAFPEIAAMILVEVCRALAHAHGLGVLHRDVKPENIMVRDDGVLKLMDFGIAQIVDSQRMTVTGQLLGSPAYMSPEHIEGRPLDFRTDVFSAGILLYQLATGELPFKGRNPHEILKRIAECRFLDARVVNPLVSDRLNKIITRALARDPDDRYPDVAPLLDDLQRFLAEVELGEPRSELKTYFANPPQYEQALRQRLIIALSKRGKAELESRHTAQALELWNRVLTIDPANEEVLSLIDRLSKRRRLTALGVGTAVALLGISGGWAVLHGREAGPAAPEPAVAAEPQVSAMALAGPDAFVAVAMHEELPAAGDPVGPVPGAPAPESPHPAIAAVARTSAPRHVEPAHQAPAVGRVFHLVPSPKNATYSLDGGKFQQIENGGVDVAVGSGAHKIVVKNPICDDYVIALDATEPGRTIVAPLTFKPTQVRAVCERATLMSIGKMPVDKGTVVDVAFHGSNKQEIKVDFVVDGRTETKSITVTAGAPLTEVKCDGP